MNTTHISDHFHQLCCCVSNAYTGVGVWISHALTCYRPFMLLVFPFTIPHAIWCKISNLSFISLQETVFWLYRYQTWQTSNSRSTKPGYHFMKGSWMLLLNWQYNVWIIVTSKRLHNSCMLTVKGMKLVTCIIIKFQSWPSSHCRCFVDVLSVSWRQQSQFVQSSNTDHIIVLTIPRFLLLLLLNGIDNIQKHSASCYQ